MDTVMVRSGKVICILGSTVRDGGGNVTGYTGVTANNSITTAPAHYKDSPWGTFQVVAQASSGNVAAVVDIYGSNDPNFWQATAGTKLGTITIAAGATPQTDGLLVTSAAPWKWIKAVLSGLSGTGASAYVLMGV